MPHRYGVRRGIGGAAVPGGGGTSNLLAGLVAAYTYEAAGNLGKDSAGTNNLTNNNAATQVAGKVSNGVNFSAASQQSLSIASNATVVMGATSWEMTTWIKFTSRPAAGFFPGIIGKTGALGLEYLLYYNGTTSRMTGQASDGTTTVEVTHADIATATWYLLDLWFDLPNHTLNLNVNNAPATALPLK